MNIHRWDHEEVHIYWDYDTTRNSSASSAISTYDIVKKIRAALNPFGPIKSFKAYSDFSGFSLPRTTNARSELSASGVTLVDCPGDGRKDASTKIMLVDLFINAWDNPPPRTFAIITGDRDLAYAVSILRTRNFRVVVICPATTHMDLTAQASSQLDWSRVVLGITGELPNITLPSQLPLKEVSAPSFGTQRQTQIAGELLNLTFPPQLPLKEVSAPSFTTQRQTGIAGAGDLLNFTLPPQIPLSEVSAPSYGTRRHSSETTNDVKSVSNTREPTLERPESLVQTASNPEPPSSNPQTVLNRARRNSLFSAYDPRQFNIFDDFDPDLATPTAGIGSFGLGDGPLFSRPRSADSAPPNIQYSSGASTPRISLSSGLPFTDIERGTRIPSLTAKGKQKEEEIQEPKVEHVLPQVPQEIVLLPQAPQEIVLVPVEAPQEDTQIHTPLGESPIDIMYSDSIFEPFGGSAPFDVPVYSSYTSDDESQSTRSMSSSSADSPFSVTTQIEEISTAPTSAEPQSIADKSDNTIKPLVVVKDSQPKGSNGTTQPLHTPRQNSLSSNIDGKQVCAKPDVPTKSETKVGSPPRTKACAQIPPIKPPVTTTPVKLPPPVEKPPKASGSKLPLPASKSQSSGVAKPSESRPVAKVPSTFATLEQTLREQKGLHPNGVSKTVLGALLPKKNPGVYKAASCSKFSRYIAAAVAAGVVVETIDTRGDQLVALSSLYA